MSVAARTTAEVELARQREIAMNSTLERTSVVLTGTALALSALGILVALVLALTWYNHPFLGVLTSNTLVVTTARPIDQSAWAGLNAGIRPFDRLLRIHGERSVPDFVELDGKGDAVRLYDSALKQLTVGELATLQIFRALPPNTLDPHCPTVSVTSDGAVCTFSFRVFQMPLDDFLMQFGIGFAVALAMLIIGVVLWFLRRHQANARLVSVLCAAAAFTVVGRFDQGTSFQLSLIWALAIYVLSITLLELALTFPYELVIVRRTPWILAVPLVVGVLGFALTFGLYQLNTAQFDGLLIAEALATISAVIMVVSLIMRRRYSASPELRDQASIALVGTAVAVAPVALWLITLLISRIAHSSNVDLTSLEFSGVYVFPPLLIFPLSLTYAVMQYRMLDTDRVVSESIIYVALGLLLIVGYLLITGAAFYVTAGTIRADNPIVIAVTLFVIAVAFSPLRVRLERAIDRSFFRQRRSYERRIEQFTRSLTTSVELKDVALRLKQEIDETVSPKYMFVFLRNMLSAEYEAFADPDSGKLQTDIRFGTNSPLVNLLSEDQSLLYLQPGQALPPELVSERARLAVLNTPLFLRLQSVNRLNGLIALGARLDGSVYQYEDLRFLESLADQAASAFQRSQMILEAQRSETELRVLAQVSSALNIVMDFDTLLEFVYTQTDKVINAPNFYIALRDQHSDDLYFAFYQEEGERLANREGYRWRMGRDLMSEVVRTGHPLKTDNYVQEMGRRDTRLHIENTAIRAWMGVPLNAGAGPALGCLAIATTDTGVQYTEDQIRIFWSIGDLAATAIYKTRLFSETEERARQMKLLNDISSRLASEFENLDALLQLITESAVEILRGEAGSLLLRDEASGDLIFQLAVGGSGQELVGSRIPAGSGIAGTVVQTGRHVIVNDTQQDNRWYGEVNPDDSDQPRRFSTRAILAVPLTTRAGVIGVLEVINKKDGTAFVEEEVNLLTAFAGQAAVAIENARLFQMTDKALADRVQQLDNMQRIDQELNRTLDFNRVVELTIDNAVRESAADAGALALVHLDPLEFEVVGSIGYPQGVLTPGEFYPISLGIMGKVYRTGQAALITALEMSSDRDYVQTLPGANGQIAVPLVTGSTVSAVLLLESYRAETFTMMTASFIQGLAEHANTAITNSQLFARLEEANQARSKFVGFVAHELKNPMASIKGYAEVLLGGMTGNMNEQQQNFVAVIRRNVVRMQQLVDDLRDLTAQETGNLTLKLAPVSFSNVIVETLRPQQRAFDEKSQTVVLNVPENLPLVWGDELRLIQVMTNFVSNANKYTPPGGTITILAEAVENRWDSTGAAMVVHCAVTDTGIGMSEEDLKKLYTPYWRSANPRAQEQPGTGLGMTLTRGLVEAHGGKIWVDSTLEVGSTFHMTVPLAPQDEMSKAPSR